MAALAARNCLVRQIDATSVRVMHRDNADREDALLELRFFVEAWTAARPGLSATVLP